MQFSRIEEGSHIGRASAACLEHEVHRHRWRLKLGQYGPQPACRDVLGDLVGQRPDDTQSGASGRDRCVRAIDREPRRDANGGFTGRAKAPFAICAGELVERDQNMLVEFGC
ncbi:hypothetical protein NTCA1_48900 [Novosphingobium sp. TCA1]|nr:hypothetical protein NTCA1_48900 [Novosphingobium sp. TCA1]